jgi:predicted anti-sigma-YlaC factor YlaD
MDCRKFRKHHVAFVDDTLPGVDVVRMQLHLTECEACAAWDHRVRRSLMLVRNNMRDIAPSDGFRSRLDERLAQERARLAAPPRMMALNRRMSLAMLSLALVSVGGAYVALRQTARANSSMAVLPAVTTFSPRGAVAAAPTDVDATPAFVASVSSGMAILPALMLADDAASAGAEPTLVQTASLSSSR